MTIVTSLSFRGQCREAFEFYAKLVGGQITAAFPYGEGPQDMPVDPKYLETGSGSLILTKRRQRTFPFEMRCDFMARWRKFSEPF